MDSGVTIQTIPHVNHRYETVGDWMENDKKNHLLVYVSNMNNWKYERLVQIHELVEATLCKARGISEKDVTNFDLEFEARQEDGNTNEPGDDPNAPYRKEHFFATSIERLIAAELGVDWEEYEEVINSLPFIPE